jgi:serine/threonine protein phosphatase 1
MPKTEMSRKIVIGDIHGALKALEQLLLRIGIHEQDTLILLGDYVDGWSQSAQTIDYLIHLGTIHDCIFIKGNHDAWCESWLNGQLPDEDWLLHGGRATLESYNAYTADQKAKHLEFFGRMKNYYIDDSNRLFIHAGFSSMHGPEKEHYITNYFWDRTLWEMALAMDKGIRKESKLYPKRLLLYPEIYIGHTPTTNYDTDIPMQACNVWNTDTGAAFMGRLTALNIDTKKFWQSDIVRHLYPDEKGRNK